MKALAILALCAATASADVEVVELKPQPVIARTIEAAPADLATAIATAVVGVLAAADKNALELAGPPFARYLSRGDRDVVEVGLPLRTRATGKLRGGVVADVLPGGPAATLVHVGPHATLPASHELLDRWLAAHHRNPAGARWEVFLTPPLAAEQQTRIVAPLSPER